MPTASEVIAYERSFVGKAKYVNDTQGPTTFDCVGLQDWCLDHFGLLYTLISGGVKPQTVYYFYSHFTGAKLPPGNAVVPGDIIIMGNPNDSDYHNVFAHIGMVSDKPGYYISAYDPIHGITEYPIPTYSTFKVVWILKTGLDQVDAVTIDTTYAIGTLTMLADHSGRRLDNSLYDHVPINTTYPVFMRYHDANDPTGIMRLAIQIGTEIVGMQEGADTSFTSKATNASTLDVVAIKADLTDALAKLELG